MAPHRSALGGRGKAPDALHEECSPSNPRYCLIAQIYSRRRRCRRKQDLTNQETREVHRPAPRRRKPGSVTAASERGSSTDSATSSTPIDAHRRDSTNPSGAAEMIARDVCIQQSWSGVHTSGQRVAAAAHRLFRLFSGIALATRAPGRRVHAVEGEREDVARDDPVGRQVLGRRRDVQGGRRGVSRGALRRGAVPHRRRLPRRFSTRSAPSP